MPASGGLLGDVHLTCRVELPQLDRLTVLIDGMLVAGARGTRRALHTAIESRNAQIGLRVMFLCSFGILVSMVQRSAAVAMSVWPPFSWILLAICYCVELFLLTVILLVSLEAAGWLVGYPLDVVTLMARLVASMYPREIFQLPDNVLTAAIRREQRAMRQRDNVDGNDDGPSDGGSGSDGGGRGGGCGGCGGCGGRGGGEDSGPAFSRPLNCSAPANGNFDHAGMVDLHTTQCQCTNNAAVVACAAARQAAAASYNATHPAAPFRGVIDEDAILCNRMPHGPPDALHALANQQEPCCDVVPATAITVLETTVDGCNNVHCDNEVIIHQNSDPFFRSRVVVNLRAKGFKDAAGLVAAAIVASGKAAAEQMPVRELSAEELLREFDNTALTLSLHATRSLLNRSRPPPAAPELQLHGVLPTPHELCIHQPNPVLKSMIYPDPCTEENGLPCCAAVPKTLIEARIRSHAIVGIHDIVPRCPNPLGWALALTGTAHRNSELTILGRIGLRCQDDLLNLPPPARTFFRRLLTSVSPALLQRLIARPPPLATSWVLARHLECGPRVLFRAASATATVQANGHTYVFYVDYRGHLICMRRRIPDPYRADAGLIEGTASAFDEPPNAEHNLIDPQVQAAAAAAATFVEYGETTEFGGRAGASGWWRGARPGDGKGTSPEQLVRLARWMRIPPNVPGLRVPVETSLYRGVPAAGVSDETYQTLLDAGNYDFIGADTCGKRRGAQRPYAHWELVDVTEITGGTILHPTVPPQVTLTHSIHPTLSGDGIAIYCIALPACDPVSLLDGRTPSAVSATGHRLSSAMQGARVLRFAMTEQCVGKCGWSMSELGGQHPAVPLPVTSLGVAGMGGGEVVAVVESLGTSNTLSTWPNSLLVSNACFGLMLRTLSWPTVIPPPRQLLRRGAGQSVPCRVPGWPRW